MLQVMQVGKRKLSFQNPCLDFPRNQPNRAVEISKISEAVDTQLSYFLSFAQALIQTNTEAIFYIERGRNTF